MVAWSSRPLLACCSCPASCRSGGEGHGGDGAVMQVCNTHHAGSAIAANPQSAFHQNAQHPTVSYGFYLRRERTDACTRGVHTACAWVPSASLPLTPPSHLSVPCTDRRVGAGP